MQEADIDLDQSITSIKWKKNVSEEMRQLGFRICTKYVESWKNIQLEQFQLKTLSGGLTNKLYLCIYPSLEVILLRIYGKGTDTFIDRKKEEFVSSALSDIGFGPKIYAVLSWGRIEQYIDAKPLQRTALADEETSTRIAKRLAVMHSISIEQLKNTVMLHEIEGWVDNALESIASLSPSQRADIAAIVQHNLKEEFAFLLRQIQSSNSPILFCHNDLQEGNILQHPDGNLTFIDYDYTNYNYRGFDFANHFCEWMIENQHTEPPYFFVKEEDFPTKEQQLRFFRAYLSSLQADVTEEILNAILKETDIFVMASHFMWSMWGLMQSKHSAIEAFGYLEYAQQRFDLYLKQKNKLSL